MAIEITVMTVEQLADLVAWHPQCNARCAGDVHAEVLWVAERDGERTDDTVVAEYLRLELREAMAVRYVGHEPTTEARPPAEMAIWDVGDDGTGRMARQVDAVPAGYDWQVGYLVRFRTTVPLAELQRYLREEVGNGERG